MSGLEGNNLDSGGLTRRTAGGAAWLIAARLITKGIDFCTLLVLARLLVPADFGIVAIAMTSVTIIEAVFELPNYQVLVSLSHVKRRHLDTAFTLGMLRGIAMALVLLIIAVPFSRFYGDSRLVGLIAILSLAPAIRGIGSPALVAYAKRLDFRPELVCGMVSKIVSFALATLTACVLRDYRALMVGILATPVAWVVVTYVLAPYRPRLSLAAWPMFAHFISWSTASQILSALNWQCDRLILGRFVTPAQLGTFSLANDLSYIPEQALINPIIRPLFSAFALIRDDRERLAAAYLTAANIVLAIGAPVLLGLSVLADPAVRLVLGGKWMAAIPILQWLSLTLIPPLFTSPYASLAWATGKPQNILRQTAAEAMTKLPLMLAGAYFAGIEGAVAARGASSIATALIVLFLTARVIGTPVLRQLAGTWRTAAGGLVLVGVLMLFRQHLHGDAGFTLGAALAFVSAIGLAGYVATLGILWHLSGRPAGIERIVFDRLISPMLYRSAAISR